MTIKPVSDAVVKSTRYLESEEALESIARDPYWPKWHSPWWHMTLLWELELAHLIPKVAVDAMTVKLKTHYLPFFPTNQAGLPAGADLYRDVSCHCAVGTMHQVLSACGVDVEAKLPWLTKWLLKYQLPDGGLNCDAGAYGGSNKSSFLSTLPAMEAVMTAVEKRPATAGEEAFLDGGSRYLLAHKVFRSSSGALINKSWLRPCFPRFYDYDLLRGLSFLVRWSAWARRPLPRQAVDETAILLETAFANGPVSSQPPVCLAGKSQIPQATRWITGPSVSFALLKDCALPGPKETLTRQWQQTRDALRLR